MYPKRQPIKWAEIRICLVAAAFAFGAAVLAIRAYRLHVHDAEALQKRADKQRTRALQVEVKRGMILDRRGEQLAASIEATSICAAPRRITDKKRTARAVADLLETKEEEIRGRLDEDKAFVWLRRRVQPTAAEKVKTANLQGVFSLTEFRRFYPQRSLAAHAIGFAGVDSKGLEGVELYYDADLRTDQGPVTSQSDALGRPIIFTGVSKTQDRRDLVLTLDRSIQYLTEKELEDAVRKEKAKSGAAVVMDADSGEILAMAVRPSYNLNVFHKASAELRRNRAVTDTFEPGSTFKVFLAAAALDLGKIAPQETFFCHHGTYKLKTTEVHDIVPRGTLSFDEVLVHSSNIGAVKISDKLSKGEFYRVLHGFGFGTETGIDLPGEAPGVLLRPGRWSDVTKANIAFGQGITVNAAQLTAAFASAINGGLLFKPRLMKKMINGAGETVREGPAAAPRRVIKASTSERIVKILGDVIAKGTGKGADIPGVHLVGKTGTAQKAAASGGYSSDKYVASFVGAIMSIKPRIAILVVIDEPGTEQRTGGKIAAPVFRRIAEGILAQCGNESADAEVTLASAAAVPNQLEKTISKRCKVRKGPGPDEWILPDLTGMNARQVLDICGKIKCDAAFHGTGTVVKQTPRAGSVFKEGDALEVSFKGQAS
jgi:cell division protein FtsI (penicillin-binding protein 3)